MDRPFGPLDDLVNESVKHDVRLYLDDATENTFRDEANRAGVSFSALLRVYAKVIREWYTSPMDRPVSDLRTRVLEIIDEAERRV